jgi:hypothetical protein
MMPVGQARLVIFLAARPQVKTAPGFWFALVPQNVLTSLQKIAQESDLEDRCRRTLTIIAGTT